MAKEFLLILILYLVVYVAREIKPLMEANIFDSIRTAVKTFTICAIDLTIYFFVFEIKLFQAKLKSDSANESVKQLRKIKKLRIVVIVTFLITSGFKIHTDAIRICGYKYCSK
jgi:hypothetical protein